VAFDGGSWRSNEALPLIDEEQGNQLAFACFAQIELNSWMSFSREWLL
jgi:hypothetical protein